MLRRDARGGQPVRLGTQVATVDECFEAIMGERGIAFTQASTQRFHDHPGLSFIPVRDVPPSPLSIAWRTDVNDELAREFVEPARTLASFEGVPNLPPICLAVLFVPVQLAPLTIAGAGRKCRRSRVWCAGLPEQAPDAGVWLVLEY